MVPDMKMVVSGCCLIPCIWYLVCLLLPRRHLVPAISSTFISQDPASWTGDGLDHEQTRVQMIFRGLQRPRLSRLFFFLARRERWQKKATYVSHDTSSRARAHDTISAMSKAVTAVLLYNSHASLWPRQQARRKLELYYSSSLGLTEAAHDMPAKGEACVLNKCARERWLFFHLSVARSKLLPGMLYLSIKHHLTIIIVFGGQEKCSLSKG